MSLAEGKFDIEYRYAEGKFDRLPDLAAELVGLKLDVIVAAPTPSVLAAKKASATTPIVFASVVDPVASGLVASLARPGGNITGLTILGPELSGKRLELLKEVLPNDPCGSPGIQPIQLSNLWKLQPHMNYASFTLK
jgi:putative ABC transport system substrate-binding protein